jgi:uncharacterized protein YbjT (DUF2867 family)
VRALVAGATGFVGTRLAASLAEGGAEVRCLVRDRSRAKDLEDAGHELHEGDVTDAASLRGAGEGIDVAYYLVHSMAGGARGDLVQRERAAAGNFARMARAEGVERLAYLGGLGASPSSEHLRARHETALALGAEGPPLTYFRAAMVVGPQSESYRLLRTLVERLPAMIAPAWLRTRTQPIAVDDVIAYLRQMPEVDASAGRAIEIGGPDVLAYSDMLEVMARALGRRPRPLVPFPLITPWLSSLWIGLVTPVDTSVARPLIEGLRTETVVTDPSGAELFDITPISLDRAIRRALAEEGERVAAAR